MKGRKGKLVRCFHIHQRKYGWWWWQWPAHCKVVHVINNDWKEPPQKVIRKRGYICMCVFIPILSVALSQTLALSIAECKRFCHPGSGWPLVVGVLYSWLQPTTEPEPSGRFTPICKYDCCPHPRGSLLFGSNTTGLTNNAGERVFILVHGILSVEPSWQSEMTPPSIRSNSAVVVGCPRSLYGGPRLCAMFVFALSIHHVARTRVFSLLETTNMS